MTRAQRLINAMQTQENVDAAIILSHENRFYISGFSSSAGLVLLTKDEAYLLVDFRYFEAASKQVKDLKVLSYHKLSDALKELVKKHQIAGVQLETGEVPYQEVKRMEEILKELFVRVYVDDRLVRKLIQLRMQKDKAEIEKIRQAQEITEQAYKEVLPHIRAGVTEREIALEIEFSMKRQGAQAVAFDLIVITGEKSSLPHGVPGENIIRTGDFVTMDIGARLDGYHSDMTRTVAVGKVTSAQRKVYETVLQAQKAALAAVKPGVVCKEIDKIARDIIYEAGFEGCFGHSTGHSVGLEIHEQPGFSPADETILLPGMIMTVEPGIYLPGRFGVRIEDMVAVTDDGCDDLTSINRELIVL